MTIEEQAKVLVKNFKPVLDSLPRMIFELERESKRERKAMLDERSRQRNLK